MLFTANILKHIPTGEVTLAFRRWRRPSVKTNGTMKTGIGVLAIESVEKISEDEIAEADAVNAGYADRRTLLEELQGSEGELYRIAFSYRGEDPRIQLREDDALTDSDFTEICARLKRFDVASRQGAWTRQILDVIRKHPGVVSGELSRMTGHEQKWFKAQVRKLKNLGLTISLEVGYKLSPRGTAFLDRLGRTGCA